MWSLIEGNPIRFSLHEFSDITGLNCEKIDEEDRVDVDHKELWVQMKVDSRVGPNWKELTDVLRECRTWGEPIRKMIGLLFVLHVGILGISRTSRIPLDYAKRVLNTDAFARFPWGRVSFKRLIDSIKVVSYENTSYVVHGCAHVLLIWAFESVRELGKDFGSKNGGDDVPLLRWDAGRTKGNIGDFLFS
ncbi:PREDICTED: uncharacterized protein LOC109127510 [Camelina sativa]|uniref:Uncharacterized protein LOC109127510 n=1 Tax=Camelina sativa TaxID=90675 RepID=A0ABM1QMH3_CAMSA|nr:PREDICTED: uncharacterized protein LOC109127510 [Camelina sativa]